MFTPRSRAKLVPVESRCRSASSTNSGISVIGRRDMSQIIAAMHIFSFHHGELTVYHETLFTILFIVLCSSISDIGRRK